MKRSASSSRVATILTAGNLLLLASLSPSFSSELRTLEHGSLRLSDGAVFSERGGTITLNDGDLLIDAKREMNVICSQCQIRIERGAVVLVKATPEINEISTLYARGSGDVHVAAGKKKVDVLEGERLYVGPQAADVIRIARQSPGRRNVIKSDVQEGSLTLLLLETSPVAILESNALLHELKKGRSAEDRRLYNKLVKMAACVTFVRARRTR
ncbi:MAG TPA: hypothetical protein V6D17_20565 [Candidatus Obscuribacterales bacterium]